MRTRGRLDSIRPRSVFTSAEIGRASRTCSLSRPFTMEAKGFLSILRAVTPATSSNWRIKRGDHRVLFFEQVELRIGRGPVLRPLLLVINQVGEGDVMPALRNVEPAAAQGLSHGHRQRQFPQAPVRASRFAFIPVQRYAPARRNKIIRRIGWQIVGLGRG